MRSSARASSTANPTRESARSSRGSRWSSRESSRNSAAELAKHKLNEPLFAEEGVAAAFGVEVGKQDRASATFDVKLNEPLFAEEGVAAAFGVEVGKKDRASATFDVEHGRKQTYTSAEGGLGAMHHASDDATTQKGTADDANLPAAQTACVSSLTATVPYWRKALQELVVDSHLHRVVTLMMAVQAACAVAIFAVGTAHGVAIYICAIYICAVAYAAYSRIDGFWRRDYVVILGIWLYTSLLTVIPAWLFASAHEDAADGAAVSGAAGVACFVLSLWFLGWGFLWYQADQIQPIQPKHHLAHMPFMHRLKLFSTAGECYNYSGFSFFPALPWKAMAVPPSVPNPQVMMLAGFFDFGGVDTQFWTFVGSAAATMLGFVLLGVYRKKPSQKFLVVQVFFELLSFPLIKQLTGVFSCTSGTIWMEDADGAGASSRFCDQSVPDEAQCMDSDPSVACWTSAEHRWYLVAVLMMIMPYYLACLQLQATANARQSVLVIDGAWSVLSIQAKFILAVIASSFGGVVRVGDCVNLNGPSAHDIIHHYPIVIVVSVELLVVSQLLLLRSGTVYSSVHSLNAIRFGGLLCAAVNGLYAAFVLWYYIDDPPCSTGGRGGSGSGTTVRPVVDYALFFGLLGANAIAIAVGVAWYAVVRRDWLSGGAASGAGHDLKSITCNASADGTTKTEPEPISAATGMVKAKGSFGKRGQGLKPSTGLQSVVGSSHDGRLTAGDRYILGNTSVLAGITKTGSNVGVAAGRTISLAERAKAAASSDFSMFDDMLAGATVGGGGRSVTQRATIDDL